MSSARHRKPTHRAGRKAPTLRPESNTSVTAGVRVVNIITMYEKENSAGKLTIKIITVS